MIFFFFWIITKVLLFLFWLNWSLYIQASRFMASQWEFMCPKCVHIRTSALCKLLVMIWWHHIMQNINELKNRKFCIFLLIICGDAHNFVAVRSIWVVKGITQSSMVKIKSIRCSRRPDNRYLELCVHYEKLEYLYCPQFWTFCTLKCWYFVFYLRYA